MLFIVFWVLFCSLPVNWTRSWILVSPDICLWLSKYVSNVLPSFALELLRTNTVFSWALQLQTATRQHHVLWRIHHNRPPGWKEGTLNTRAQSEHSAAVPAAKRTPKLKWMVLTMRTYPIKSYRCFENISSFTWTSSKQSLKTENKCRILLNKEDCTLTTQIKSGDALKVTCLHLPGCFPFWSPWWSFRSSCYLALATSTFSWSLSLPDCHSSMLSWWSCKASSPSRTRKTWALTVL